MGGPADLHGDGRSFVITTSSGVVLWELDPAHQFEAVCRIAGRAFTAEEWSTYLADLGPRRSTCAAAS